MNRKYDRVVIGAGTAAMGVALTVFASTKTSSSKPRAVRALSWRTPLTRPSLLVRKDWLGQVIDDHDMLGATTLVSAHRSNAGRPKTPIRLLASLVYLEHSFNLSDEDVCALEGEPTVAVVQRPGALRALFSVRRHADRTHQEQPQRGT